MEHIYILLWYIWEAGRKSITVSQVLRKVSSDHFHFAYIIMIFHLFDWFNIDTIWIYMADYKRLANTDNDGCGGPLSRGGRGSLPLPLLTTPVYLLIERKTDDPGLPPGHQWGDPERWLAVFLWDCPCWWWMGGEGRRVAGWMGAGVKEGGLKGGMAYTFPGMAVMESSRAIFCYQ